MKKIILYLFSALLFAAGLVFFLYPTLQTAAFKHDSRREIDSFRESVKAEGLAVDTAEEKDSGETAEPDSKAPETAAKYERLLENMKAYNKRIYEEKQTSLCDAWSYRQSIFDFEAEGIEVSMIGYITIEAMDVEIPLYVGASEENLRVAAAVLGQTSMPIGGENTNCVIAAHRGGYYGAAMFRDIELLKKGDIVEITNLWETLEYEVVKTIVISPDEIEAVKIIEGEDMVTLITCHPYPQNYQRYVVYCRRVTEEKEAQADMTDEAADIPYEGIDYEPSEPVILREIRVRRIAVGVFGVVFVTAVILLIKKAKRQRR